MTYEESFCTGIVGNNYKLKAIKNEIVTNNLFVANKHQ